MINLAWLEGEEAWMWMWSYAWVMKEEIDPDYSDAEFMERMIGMYI